MKNYLLYIVTLGFIFGAPSGSIANNCEKECDKGYKKCEATCREYKQNIHSDCQSSCDAGHSACMGYIE